MIIGATAKSPTCGNDFALAALRLTNARAFAARASRRVEGGRPAGTIRINAPVGLGSAGHRRNRQIMADRTVVTPSAGTTTTTTYETAGVGLGGPAGLAAPAPFVDWAAIIAGAISAIAIGLVMTSFGAALGLGNISAEQGEGSGNRSLILTAIWALLTVLVSYFMGGYVAGRMRRSAGGVSDGEARSRDSLHGLTVWALGVLLSAYLFGSLAGSALNAAGSVASTAARAAGSVVQGAGNVVGGAASAAADAATGEGGGAGGLLDLSNFDPIQAVNNRLLRGTGERIDSNAELSPLARDVVFETARTGELTDENRQILAGEIARVSTLTPEEANARIDEAVAQITQLREDAQARVDQAAEAARNAAETARRAAVGTALVAGLAALIALATAVYGAGVGGRHRDEGRHLLRR